MREGGMGRDGDIDGMDWMGDVGWNSLIGFVGV